jgi:hypothetical protein
MKMKIFYSSLLISFIMMACGPKIPTEKMAEIDTLELKLDSAQQRLVAIDSAKAFEMVNNYEAKLSFFLEDVQDTLPREEAFFIDSWYRLRKVVRKYATYYSPLLNEIKISKQQMKDLRFDSENGLLEEKHFDEYLELEKENVESVTISTHEMMEKFEKFVPLYEKKLPRMDSLYAVYKDKYAKVEE